MAGDKTEKATPKRREEARKKGQVARSQDLNGAAVLLAGVLALGVTGPGMADKLGEGLRDALKAGAGREPVTISTVGDLLLHSGTTVALCLAPIVGVCAVTAILVSLAQVGIRPKTEAIRP